jgi:hypothetical protein
MPHSSIHWWLISCGVADCDSTSTAIENLSGLPARRFQVLMGWFHYAVMNWRLILTMARFSSLEIDAARPSKF